ncbi:MAG: hypothetical protein VKP62_08425 [Candidatus Sericytochromatia bacterium]|nr:hypothetical protein [Candidatus Sericytochromatia bacterium]
MNKHAGGRPAKSGARRELKTFRLVPDAIKRLEGLAHERGGSTSDVLNELILHARRTEAGDAARARLEVIPGHGDGDTDKVACMSRFRVLTGRGPSRLADDVGRVSQELARLRDGLGAVLGEIEALMSEQLLEPTDALRKGARAQDPYGQGFKDGMLEALETAYSLLQAELLISEGF